MSPEARKEMSDRIMSEPTGNLYEFAKSELARLQEPGDEMQELMNSQLLEMVHLFSSHGHSGFSASYALAQLQRLLAWEPLTPLTGADDEWNEVGDGTFQNKRCSRVFKDRDRFDGQPYDIDAIVFREGPGQCYTSRDSAQPITFPYTPTTTYVDVPKVDNEHAG